MYRAGIERDRLLRHLRLIFPVVDMEVKIGYNS